MYDVIVIGSGIGGLTAAGLLAKVAGKKVLVLEKHTEPGGLTHVFRRDGAEWDVGLHYVGQLGSGTLIRSFFDYLSGEELRWRKMTDDFERFVYPGLDFAVPSDPKQFQQRLVEKFPEETQAIKSYFRDIRSAQRWAVLGFVQYMLPRPLEPFIRLYRKLISSKPTQTTKAYMESRFRSPVIRALLTSQWGDYGLVPEKSAFAIHAQIAHHYLEGAWFPEGGSDRIARSFEKGIEQAGGVLRVAQHVVEILVEGDCAVGVRVIDQRGAEPRECIYRAPIIISNVGAPLTFKSLLPTIGSVGTKTAPIRQLIEDLGESLSAVTLYLRLQESPETLGIKGENYWINTDLNHDDEKGSTEDLLAGQPRRVYVSFPSVKAGDKDHFHTVEIISAVNGSAFDRWRNQPKGNRGTEYSALKERISEGMLNLAETVIPGLRRLIIYAELSTPLSIEHYTSHPKGCFYGLPFNPMRCRSNLLGPRTVIRGLYLSGSDAGCPGIAGALMGSVGTVCQIIGSRGFSMIRSAMQKRCNDVPAFMLPKEKKRATLVEKISLTPTVWQLCFEVDSDVDDYAAGQFAKVHVGDNIWRDYTIAGLEGRRRVHFLISTRTGGKGSRFVETALAGTTTMVELPLGRYTLMRNQRSKVFIATGTGLAPFLPMFQELKCEGNLGKATLIFGCRNKSEDITENRSPLPEKIIRCFSQENRLQQSDSLLKGRVTDALIQFPFDPETTEFYLCGSSAMIAESRKILEQKSAQHILIENY